MQTSKYLFAAGVLAAVILPLQVQGGPDTEEQAKMRDALRRALEQPTTPQSRPVPAAPAPAPAVPVQPAPVTPPPQPVPVAPPPVTPTVVVQTPETFEAVPPPDSEANLARAREAMRQKLQESQSVPATAKAATAPVAAVAPTAPAASTARPVAAVAPVATSSFKPIESPASPLSGSKQAKLADLLARYRADSITAQEYHAQRAAIIAEP
jgi:hypothetical protein